MSCDLFISHATEDEQDARALATALKQCGYQAWIYEEESNLPGFSYLDWIIGALKECKAVVVLISPATPASEQVGREITTAFENGKKLIPILKGISYPELKQARPTWCHAFGTALAVPLPREGAAAMAAKIVASLQAMGIRPAAGPSDGERAAAANTPAAEARSPAGQERPLHTPPFHCGGVLPPEYYIGREEELAQAREFIRTHQSFLLVGDLRSGKTSFCGKLIAEVLADGERITLPILLNLQQCHKLDKRGFLSHTILSMVGDTARIVFKRKYTEMLGRAAGAPASTESPPEEKKGSPR